MAHDPTGYRFDPDLATAAPSLAPLDPDDHGASRAAMTAMTRSLPTWTPRAPIAVDDLPIPGPDGPVAVRIYRPTVESGPRPGIVYLHWGGFVAGGLDVVDADGRRLADEVGAVVVSIDYRLAPEHRYPAAVEDAYAGLVWLAGSAEDLGVDRARIAVAGESAGGGLAAALTLLSRDRGGPSIAFQALGFPQLDDRADTVSATSFVDTPMWDRASLLASWRDYLGPGEPGGRDVEPYAAPARAVHLAGLPPAFVTACEFDPLRDEAINYAARLVRAGVGVDLQLYRGTFHASTAVADAEVSRRMLADRSAALVRGLS
ncbi:alpha/beta hydrolase [Williamsia sterculiae]|uniref:Acetyl esterase/lipase n=1 Tax=Williamsia sterculiae TaxID=1344003 RepID=A0A1N7CGQ9_9NOCA|nr:alpha/beta hydrolase [Williamsia sterculiae]SIR62614.1 Acetyl esterase/lipase [Williamsia sterculiae]